MSHGGKRAGAGRPKKLDARVTLSVRIMPITRMILDETVDNLGISTGQLIDELVQEVLR